MKLKGFLPFVSAANALENANNVSEGIVNDDLKAFLEQNLPRVKAGKKAKFIVGVVRPTYPHALLQPHARMLRGLPTAFHVFHVSARPD